MPSLPPYCNPVSVSSSAKDGSKAERGLSQASPPATLQDPTWQPRIYYPGKMGQGLPWSITP